MRTGKKTLAPVLAGLLLSALATGLPAHAAAAAQGAGNGPGNGPGGMGGCGNIVRLLTPEQHAMYFKEMHVDTGTMTVNAFRELKRTQCAKFAAMTPAETKTYADGLQAKWDKLSDKEKLQAYHDMLAWRDMGRGTGRGKGRGMGGGGR